MQTLEGLANLKSIPPGGVVSVGNFDGLHRGHQHILSTARALRASTSGPFTVITFEPHPLTVLAPEKAPPRLTPPAIKSALLKDVGADYLLILPPTRDVLDLTAEVFWQRLRDDLQPRHMVEGRTFNFGKGRGGTIDRLREWSARDGVRLNIVSPIEVALLDLTIAPVSSSLIRWLLGHGRARDAAICLGRPYALQGKVIQGYQRGRTIGVPTANLDCGEQLVPLEGVYAGRCAVNGDIYPAAVSIGRMATFGSDLRFQIEAHLLDFNADLYGQTLRVDLLDWVRPQLKFAGVEELMVRMKRDIDFTRTRASLVVEREVASV